MLHIFTDLLIYLLVVQGTLRDLSKGGRNIPMDQIEPVCVMRKARNILWPATFFLMFLFFVHFLKLLRNFLDLSWNCWREQFILVIGAGNSN